MREKPTLLFVSTRFLLPVDSGGKIRTTQILRGLKGGRFRIVLVSPATSELARNHATELQELCDEFHWWIPPRRSPLFHYTRLRHLASPLPIPVRTDRHAAGRRLVRELLEGLRPSLAVFDFAHAGVLAPDALPCPSVMFTHNVEAEIFRRHLDVAKNPVTRALWANQHRKMLAYEADVLRRFDVVVAVSDRDAGFFKSEYGVEKVFVIPTGVDLDYFAYAPPRKRADIVFCGSMDWLANQEAVVHFMDEGWSAVTARVPDAQMTVVGRSPPPALVAEAARRGLRWRFTGYVEDVRPYVQGAVSVLPLRVGGGTRLKVYEAMAMGSPLVSTSIGVEGLPVNAGEHYVLAESAADIGRAAAELLLDDRRREEISLNARKYVEHHCSYRIAAKVFEEACEAAMARGTRRAAGLADHRSAVGMAK